MLRDRTNPVRRNAAYVGWGLCFYAVWRQVVFAIEAALPYHGDSGIFDVLAVMSGIILLQIYFRKSILPKTLFHTKQHMSVKQFLFLLCVFFAAQLVYTLLGNGMELTLELFGFTAVEQAKSIPSEGETFWFFLYTAFFAPLGEELIYRGFVLRRFEQYGKIYAIVLSSLLFSIMHGNLFQMIFAFLAGLVLGYVALEYSILWSILLHIINNFLYGEVLSFLIADVSPAVQDYIYRGINIFFFAVGAFWLLHRRSRLLDYFHQNRTQKRYYRLSLINIGILLFLAWGIYQALCGISRLV